jgi:probable F420-dependent oxidoreductase
MGEHTHIPTSRATPYPAGGELPGPYTRMMDPYVGLMLAASATSTLKVGTAVSLSLQHHVLALAKTVATLDRLAGGRVLYGVGVGWNREELANHSDVPWSRRYLALEECVAALRCLWTDEEAEFHGEYFDFDPVWSLPKPLQSEIPVVCGMSGRLGTAHAVRWADVWMPMDVALGDVASGRIEKKIGLFRQAAADAGRGEVPINLLTFGDPTLETLQYYASLGVERTVVGGSRIGWDDPSTTMPFLDRYAEMIPELQ